MKKHLLALSLASLMGFSGGSYAMTGNQFLERCSDPALGQHFCESMMVGFFYGVIAQSDATQTDSAVCVKEGFSIKQTTDIAKRYIDQYPKVRDQHISAVLIEALNDWNPC